MKRARDLCDLSPEKIASLHMSGEVWLHEDDVRRVKQRMGARALATYEAWLEARAGAAAAAPAPAAETPAPAPAAQGPAPGRDAEKAADNEAEGEAEEEDAAALGRELFARRPEAAGADAPSLVLPATATKGGLVLSAYATLTAAVRQHDARLVLQCASEHADSFEETHPELAADVASGRVRVMQLPMDDEVGFDPRPALAAALPALAAARLAGDTAVVGCSAGASRSALLVVAHLMAVEALSLCAALALARAARRRVCVNYGFALRLLRLEAAAAGRGSVPPAALRQHPHVGELLGDKAQRDAELALKLGCEQHAREHATTKAA
jgi:hypothetical protein